MDVKLVFRSFNRFQCSYWINSSSASFIEKHICLNTKVGIDSKFSLEVNKIKTLKKEVSLAFQSKGKIFYGPTKNELSYLRFRRSIYASKRIKKGEKFTKENIKIVRPALD